MTSFRKRIRQSRLGLQAKITLVLLAVIVPTFLVVTVAQNKFTQPALAEQMREIGLSSAKSLALEISTSRLFSSPNPGPLIESRIQDLLFSEPNIIRIDVYTRDPSTGGVKTVASNFEDDAASSPENSVRDFSDTTETQYRTGEAGQSYWEIYVPIESKARDPRGPKRVMGVVHLLISMKILNGIVSILWKTSVTAAFFSLLTLLLALSYFLRKTIENDRRLKQAETQNVQLVEQLHEAQRQIMNTEKLAVMGQLTASFAHEIGTPLNAIGGHLQLLKEELAGAAGTQRLEIIDGQVSKIEEIVKSFLQSTAKPVSQKQLVDLNRLVDKTLGIVMPRVDSIGVEVKRVFEREMGPIRVVPLDLEQIFLNLLNNSLDSLDAKIASKGGRGALEIRTDLAEEKGKTWALVSVYDTGEGISKDLGNVLKPFFTTKRPGEGTGLGLTICQQLAHKYGGYLEIDSKEGAWAKVVLKLPYTVNT